VGAPWTGGRQVQLIPNGPCGRAPAPGYDWKPGPTGCESTSERPPAAAVFRASGDVPQVEAGSRLQTEASHAHRVDQNPRVGRARSRRAITSGCLAFQRSRPPLLSLVSRSGDLDSAAIRGS